MKGGYFNEPGLATVRNSIKKININVRGAFGKRVLYMCVASKSEIELDMTHMFNISLKKFLFWIFSRFQVGWRDMRGENKSSGRYRNIFPEEMNEKM